jgi:2-dehydro-3-deoxyglucarate aldolase/4-hydroxy-2-oxoheptanedioate aldolase
MPSRPKSLAQRAVGGDLVTGAMVFECFLPGMAQIMKNAGCEFVLYDMEHSGLSIETLKMLCATCRGLDIEPMVRVPRGEYHFIARALDVGARGVMVPMVESAAQAEAIRDAMRYPPEGRRGAAFGFAHDGYVAGNVLQTMKQANARNLAIAQIETERGLAAVDEIAAVKGIDVLWLGHFDLTNFLGIPGQFDNPLFIDAVKRIVAAARRHKKGLGFMPASADLTEQYRALGFNVFGAGTDQGILANGVAQILKPLRT